MFIDDNVDEESHQMLYSFKREMSTVVVLPGKNHDPYVCDDESHYWNDRLMLKVANYKNDIIDYAVENGYDYLFFVDSDLVLHPNLNEHLKSKEKEIISELFWSQWHTNLPLEPNVWLFDESDLVPLLRYKSDFQYQWQETPQHCGRFTSNSNSLSTVESEFRIQHFGWAVQEDRVAKYKRYQLLDPGAIYGIRKQYESILDSSPHLITWQ